MKMMVLLVISYQVLWWENKCWLVKKNNKNNDNKTREQMKTKAS